MLWIVKNVFFIRKGILVVVWEMGDLGGNGGFWGFKMGEGVKGELYGMVL